MRTTVLNHFHTFHPEAQAEFDALVREEKRLTLEIARKAEGDAPPPPKRRASQKLPPSLDDELAAVRARMDEQRAIIKSGIVRVIVKGLTRGEFRRLLTEHKPRPNEDLDERLGYNTDTFGDALIQACIVGTQSQDGETVPCEWDKWADDMTNGQWEEFFTACLKITNDGAPSLPR